MLRHPRWSGTAELQAASAEFTWKRGAGQQACNYCSMPVSAGLSPPKQLQENLKRLAKRIQLLDLSGQPSWRIHA